MGNIERLFMFSEGGGIIGGSLRTSDESLFGIIFGYNQGFGVVTIVRLTLWEADVGPMVISDGFHDGDRFGEDM